MQRVTTNWNASIVWAISNFATGLVVKVSGEPRAQLLFGQFLSASIVLLLVVVARDMRRPRAPIQSSPRASDWVWMTIRTGGGIALTFMAYEGYARCFGFAPTLLSLNAVYLPLAGLVFTSLLAGKRRKVVVASAAICVAGVLIGSTDLGGSCQTLGLVYGLIGGVGLSLLALVQQKIEIEAAHASAIYCGAAACVMGVVGIASSGHLTISRWSIALGAIYALVQWASQLANRADPVTASVVGLSQMPLSTGTAQFVLGEAQPVSVWVASLLVCAGILLLKMKGDRRLTN